jgi:putative ribosome biogenesis GTPase RsgA
MNSDDQQPQQPFDFNARRKLLEDIANGTLRVQKAKIVKGKVVYIQQGPTTSEQLAAIAELNRMDKLERMQKANRAKQVKSELKESLGKIKINWDLCQN